MVCFIELNWRETSFIKHFSILGKPIPKYADQSRELVFSNPSDKSLTLSCQNRAPEYKLKWYVDVKRKAHHCDNEKTYWFFGSFYRAKYGQDVSQVAELKDRYTIEGNSFTINEPSRNDHGNYTCSIDELNLTANIRVVGKCCWIKLKLKLKIIHDMHLICSNWFTAVAHLKKLEKTRSVTEGDELRIHCESSGTVSEITWKISELKKTLLIIIVGSIFKSSIRPITIIWHIMMCDDIIMSFAFIRFSNRWQRRF